jgi:hypothetical protein
MSFDCSDFQQCIYNALDQRGLLPRNADPQNPSEAADLCLAAIAKLAKQRRVLIHVRGGVAYLVRASRDVAVNIRDFDNEAHG